MNETDVRDVLARALAAPAPDRIDVDRAIASGVRRRRRRAVAALGSIVVALGVVAAVLLAGLPRGSSPVPTVSSSTAPLAGTRWVLTSYADARGQLVDAATTTNSQASLWFLTDTQLTGSTGCNGFGGTYTARGSSLTISQPSVNQMRCGGASDVQEPAVLEGLGRVASYAVVSGSLHLLDSSGSLVLSYAPQDLDLGGSSWRVTSISNDKADGTSVPSSATARMTLELHADGSVTGSDGCNQFGGTWESNRPGRLYLSGFGGTERACADMVSPQRYLAMLARVTSYGVNWDRLTLTQDGGMGMITLQRVDVVAPSPTPSGTPSPSATPSPAATDALAAALRCGPDGLSRFYDEVGHSDATVNTPEAAARAAVGVLAGADREVVLTPWDRPELLLSPLRPDEVVYLASDAAGVPLMLVSVIQDPTGRYIAGVEASCQTPPTS